MERVKVIQSVIDFQLRGRPQKFTVYHNLAEMGLDISAAFENWTVRTRNYTVQSFVRYVKSKDRNIICLTETEYQKLNQ